MVARAAGARVLVTDGAVWAAALAARAGTVAVVGMAAAYEEALAAATKVASEVGVVVGAEAEAARGVSAVGIGAAEAAGRRDSPHGTPPQRPHRRRTRPRRTRRSHRKGATGTHAGCRSERPLALRGK